MNLERPVVATKLFGMDIEYRQPYVSRDGTVYNMAPLITMVVEDDEAWHRKDFVFDAGWLDDLIACATAARDHINKGM